MNGVAPVTHEKAGEGCLILDAQDNVVGGDPLLVDYHLIQGGEEGGCLALPTVLQLVAMARTMEMKLHRKVRFIAGRQEIVAWASVHPGEPETIVRLSQIEARASITATGPIPSQFALRLQAEAWLHVDADNVIISGQCTPALAAQQPQLPAQLQRVLGGRWSAFLQPAEDSDLITLYQRGQLPAWQMLDGAVMASTETPSQRWIARIFALDHNAMFEWLLLPVDGLAVTALARTTAYEGAETAETDAPTRLFADQVAPALRGPVGRIMANAQTIRDRANGPLRQDYVSYAGNIADAAEHLLALIDDASALEEVDNPDETLDIHVLDLVDVARRACGLLAMKAAARDIRLDCPKEDESVMCRGDFRRILQILLNLLGNAIRYSPESSMVWLRAEEDGDVSRLIVSDQGSGLSREQQARVFNKFERLGRSDDGGSGLGLYIARRLARAMEGDIIIDSAPGQGARFIVELPGAEAG